MKVFAEKVPVLWYVVLKRSPVLLWNLLISVYPIILYWGKKIDQGMLQGRHFFSKMFYKFPLCSVITTVLTGTDNAIEQILACHCVGVLSIMVGSVDLPFIVRVIACIQLRNVYQLDCSSA